ncbi:fatty acid hydroxylase domain-containing protein 2-like [Diadema setosum]|uniref:fatty acid hydroxylase domain-containing protein 2-like n=1 Tax=Diadema setosum TaxID=31175 RepID=UPI003B3A35DA
MESHRERTANTRRNIQRDSTHSRPIERDFGQCQDDKSSLEKQETDLKWTFSVFALATVLVGVVLRHELHDRSESHYYYHPSYVIRNLWGSYYDYFAGSWSKMGLCLFCLAVLEYWVLGCLFLITDLTHWPSFIAKFKVQRDQTKIPRDKLLKAMATAFINQTVFNFPSLLMVDYLMRWRGCGHTVDELPTFSQFLIEFAVFTIIEEIGFYYGHRLLHQPALYASYHKQHHEWTAPIGLITVYCHPVEHFLANTVPAVVGPILMGSHLLTTSVWLVVAQTVAMITHCGYHLPLLPSPEAHDFHHLKFTNNFGVLGILDWLHGTDVNFRKTKQFQRHFTLFGLTPVNDSIPDEPKIAQ